MALTKVTGAGVEGVTISSTTDTSDQFILTNTDTGSSSGPDLVLFRQSTSSAADSDGLGRIDFRGLNDANEEINYATIFSKINDASDGTEDGELYVQQIVGGSFVETAKFDASGNFLVGHDDYSTAVDDGSTGVTMGADGKLTASRSGDVCFLNREGGFGTVIEIREDGTAKGKIRTTSGVNDISIAGQRGTGCGIKLTDNELMPVDKSGNNDDDEHDIGHPSVRWDDIRATNGTIQTSDENEKQDIASLTSAEITAATAISKLFKTYRWKDKVAKKAKIGVTARTHTGVIAQQVKTAMKDAGLDETKYAFWGSDTWWESYEKYTEDGEEITAMHVWKTESEAPKGATKKTRLSIRYAELMAFIGASTEQRLASIEARLTALEAK